MSTDRAQWVARLLPEGVPSLWCPPLTHYDQNGIIDRERIAAHWRALAPWVKAMLVPGSTGDGWELTSQEQRQMIEVSLELARDFGLHVLIGALHSDAAEARNTISRYLTFIRDRTDPGEAHDGLVQARVCGFAVCPPRGAGLSQAKLETALVSILDLGVPVALYQLPQITQNEMSPELVAALAQRFGNFLLFKDTSGTDRVAQSGCDFADLFLVRGMEGDYARWLKEGGGPYDGFLLSGANCFAPQLHRLMQDLAAGRTSEANRLSDTLTQVVGEVFRLVDGIPVGNAFANANKALDHFMAYGAKAAAVTPPRLHAGSRLPTDVVRLTGEALTRHSLMPSRGYLE